MENPFDEVTYCPCNLQEIYYCLPYLSIEGYDLCLTISKSILTDQLLTNSFIESSHELYVKKPQ